MGINRTDPNYTLLTKMQKRWQVMLTERGKFDSHVSIVAQNLLPRQSRFFSSDRNRGGDRNQAIIDSAGTQALRVLAAGMMAGMTSPARPWFRLDVPDPELAKNHEVKLWLSDVTKLMLRVFRKSNTYNTLHFMYRELGGFGTGCSVIQPDFDNVIHHNPMTFGEYAIALDDKGVPNTLGREFTLDVEQAITWFGYDAVSATARAAYDQSNYGYQVNVLHTIEPRVERDLRKQDAKNMAWASRYAEVGRTGSDNRPSEMNGLLRESGYKMFPAITPRWDVLFNDTYGSSPGMDALGDILQLQQEQYRKSEGIDYQARPPLQVPVALRDNDANFLPGGVSYYDGTSPGSGIRSAFDVRLDLQYLLQDIAEVKTRINSAFYADMFLMLATMDKTNMTATEVAERHEEKLLMLGPVLERLHNEMLSPLVENTFARMVAVGMVPPPPEALNGVDLDVEFVSMLAQAQRAVGVNAVDRLVSHVGVLANAKPEVVDNFDADKSVQQYAEALGVDPELIVASEQVALVRQQRAQQEAQARAAEIADKAAGAVGKLGGVQTNGGQSNAGSDLLNLFSGYISPSSTEL